MKIYIISLKESPRRDTIKLRLETIDANYEFIDAIDKNKLSTQVKQEVYDSASCRIRHGRELVDAEIACFLSHIKAWKKIAEEDISAIILEDDALLTADFKFAATTLSEEHNSEADIVLLGHSKHRIKDEKSHYFNNPIFNVKKSGRLSTGQVFKLWTSGMVGYHITPEGAKKLINANKTIKCVSDDWNYHSTNGLVIQEMRPYVVWEDFDNMPSSIEAERSIATRKRSTLLSYMLHPARFIRAIYRNILARTKVLFKSTSHSK